MAAIAAKNLCHRPGPAGAWKAHPTAATAASIAASPLQQLHDGRHVRHPDILPNNPTKIKAARSRRSDQLRWENRRRLNRRSHQE